MLHVNEVHSQHYGLEAFGSDSRNSISIIIISKLVLVVSTEMNEIVKGIR